MLVGRPPIAVWRNGGGKTRKIFARESHALGEYHGVVPDKAGSTRIDLWISGQMPYTSRARVQDSIRKGLALVNGKTITKPSFPVSGNDHVTCTLCGAAPLEARPEDIQLDIVYEDDSVIVVNKSADMVVHPAPGHYGGTLVNAILHHCGLPPVGVSLVGDGEDGEDDDDSDEGVEIISTTANPDPDDEHEEAETEKFKRDIPSRFRGPMPVIRPGIVHRLDRGTSGLMVVAKMQVGEPEEMDCSPNAVEVRLLTRPVSCLEAVSISRRSPLEEGM